MIAGPTNILLFVVCRPFLLRLELRIANERQRRSLRPVLLVSRLSHKPTCSSCPSLLLLSQLLHRRVSTQFQSSSHAGDSTKNSLRTSPRCTLLGFALSQASLAFWSSCLRLVTDNVCTSFRGVVPLEVGTGCRHVACGLKADVSDRLCGSPRSLRPLSSLPVPPAIDGHAALPTSPRSRQIVFRSRCGGL